MNTSFYHAVIVIFPKCIIRTLTYQKMTIYHILDLFLFYWTFNNIFIIQWRKMQTVGAGWGLWGRGCNLIPTASSPGCWFSDFSKTQVFIWFREPPLTHTHTSHVAPLLMKCPSMECLHYYSVDRDWCPPKTICTCSSQERHSGGSKGGLNEGFRVSV